MLDSFEYCDCFMQPIDLFVQDEANRDHYDAVLWYNMNWDAPGEGSALRAYMENDIGKTKQGIVFIHHVIRGIKDFPVVDEAYTMGKPEELGIGLLAWSGRSSGPPGGKHRKIRQNRMPPALVRRYSNMQERARSV